MRGVLVFLCIIVVLLATRFEQSLASNSQSKERRAPSFRSSLDVDTLIQESLDDLSAKIKDFQNDPSHRRRPFVTLAYAQSIDGKIALVVGDDDQRTSSNFAISGPESLRLTHALRSIHDAILVGGKTLSVDNPRLTNRLWPFPPNNQNPCVPVILDTHLHHIRLLGKTMRVQNPIVCCSARAYEQACKNTTSTTDDDDFGRIVSSVTLLPCKTKHVDKKNDNKAKTVLDLCDVLRRLRHEHGIHSVMVEGGASVLSLFATAEGGDHQDDERFLFDCLCVTVSPKLLGSNGLDSLSSFGGTRRMGNNNNNRDGIVLGPIRCTSLGEDCVLFADRQRC